MHLSTSSFERKIPVAKWGIILPFSFAMLIVLMVSFELFARSKGYGTTLNDEKYLWAKTRESVKPDSVVIIGSSRGLFDFDLDELENALQTKDVKQLAMTGSSPTPVLASLANDKNFKGTVICDVVPGLYFTPDFAPPVLKPTEWVKAYEHFSPSERTNLLINNFLESHLAYLKQDDLTLKELLKNVELPNREGTVQGRKLPPYFLDIDNRRECKMIPRVLEDKSFRERIQNGWIPLFTPPPFPPFIKPEQIPGIIENLVAGKIQFTKNCVEKLKEHGAKIIFVRLPSSGPLKELESKLTPRVAIWDRLIKETGADGIYWEDYDNLKSFDCPEWSHLSAEDSVKFTKEIGPIIKTQLSK